VERISLAVRSHFDPESADKDNAGADEMADAEKVNDEGILLDGVRVRDTDRMAEATLAELTESGELAGDEGVAVDGEAVREPVEEEVVFDPQDLADMLAAAEGEIIDKDKEPGPGTSGTGGAVES
jgi:hypothetical protein